MFKTIFRHFRLLLPIALGLTLVGYSDYALQKSHNEVVRLEFEYRNSVINNWFTELESMGTDESVYFGTLLRYSQWLDNRNGIYARLLRLDDQTEVDSSIYENNDRTDKNILSSEVLFESSWTFPADDPEWEFVFKMSPQYYNTHWVADTSGRINFGISIIMVLYFITRFIHLRKCHNDE